MYDAVKVFASALRDFSLNADIEVQTSDCANPSKWPQGELIMQLLDQVNWFFCNSLEIVFIDFIPLEIGRRHNKSNYIQWPTRTKLFCSGNYWVLIFRRLKENRHLGSRSKNQNASHNWRSLCTDFTITTKQNTHRYNANWNAIYENQVTNKCRLILQIKIH